LPCGGLGRIGAEVGLVDARRLLEMTELPVALGDVEEQRRDRLALVCGLERVERFRILAEIVERAPLARRGPRRLDVVAALRDRAQLRWTFLFNLCMDAGDAVSCLIPLVRRQGIYRAAASSLAFALFACTACIAIYVASGQPS